MSYELEILVNGKPVTKYAHEGHIYVEGRRGSDYALRFHNNTSNRVVAVLSVDGLSVMHGKEAKFSDPGYVVDPFSSITVPGWRLDNTKIAKFKFGDRGKSYASKKGQPMNVGVIGCAVFEEQVANWFLSMYPATVICNSRAVQRGLFEEYSTCNSTSGDCGDGVTISDTTLKYIDDGEVQTSSVLRSNTSDSRACSTGTVIRSCGFTPDSARTVGNLGTEFGKKDQHVVQEVDVKRKPTHSAIIEIHYDTRAGLEARGIKLHNVTQVARAFPSETYGIGCTPPDGWKGQ